MVTGTQPSPCRWMECVVGPGANPSASFCPGEAVSPWWAWGRGCSPHGSLWWCACSYTGFAWPRVHVSLRGMGLGRPRDGVSSKKLQLDKETPWTCCCEIGVV